MNIGKWGIIAEHFAVDCSYHQLLHLPLQNDRKANNLKAIAILMWFAGQGKQENLSNHTIEVWGDDTCSLMEVSSASISFSSSWKIEGYRQDIFSTAFPVGERASLSADLSPPGWTNPLLVGIPSRNLQRLQYVHNSAARVLMRMSTSPPSFTPCFCFPRLILCGLIDFIWF